MLEQQNDLTVLDIRDMLSASGRPVILPRAKHLPFGDLMENLQELSLEKPMVIYCDCPKDQTAVEAVKHLREIGAKDVRWLRGGLSGWIRDGHSVLDYMTHTGIPLIADSLRRRSPSPNIPRKSTMGNELANSIKTPYKKGSKYAKRNENAKVHT